MARVGMADRDGFGHRVVDGEVRGEFARSFPCAGELVALAIHHAEHVGLHEALADSGGSDNEAVGREARGDVAAIAVAVFAHPDAAADVANLLLERLRLPAS